MNLVTLIGRIGKDPEVRAFNEGKLVNVTLATTERGYKLKNGTEVPDHTDWHNLRFRGGLAEVVEKYVHKGDTIAVSGKVQYRSYEKDGKNISVTEINVDSLDMLTKKKDGESAQAPATAPAPEKKDDLPF